MKNFLFRQFYRVYRISRWFQCHFSLAGQLLLGAWLMAAIFGLDMRQTQAYQLFSLLSAVLLLALFAGQWLRGQFNASRRLPEFAMSGQTFHYTLSIHNPTKQQQKQLYIEDRVIANKANSPSHWMAYPRWLWLMQQQQGAIPQRHQLNNLAAQQSQHIHYEITPLRRGYLHFDHTLIGISEPLGLYYKVFQLKNPAKLLVLPQLYAIPPLQLGDKRRYQAGGVAQTVSVAEGAIEFMSLREYRAGDALRNIHWKSWAKRGKPIVKEYQDEYYTRHALILDTFIRDGQEPAFEAAVSLAASFASHLVNQDSLLDLLFVGEKAYCHTSGHGLSPVNPMLEILACVQPCYHKSFQQLAPLLQQHQQALSGAVCILLDWDSTRQHILTQLQQHGLPLTLFLISQKPENYQQHDLPANLHLLPHDNIQQSLAKL